MAVLLYFGDTRYYGTSDKQRRFSDRPIRRSNDAAVRIVNLERKMARMARIFASYGT
jgi:hypothetical protein